MKRTAILSVTLLIIFCASASRILFAFASYTSASTIASSGIIKEKSVEPTRIFLVAYGTAPFYEENRRHIAEHFDLVDISSEMVQYATNIKALNPDIVIIAYQDVMAMDPKMDDWAIVDAHEDWFLHDVDGNRLQRPPWNWYAMDVGNPEWREHFTNRVLNLLQTYPAVDGIFADDAWKNFQTGTWLSNAVPDPSIAPRWYNDMASFLQYVKNAISDKLFIPNTHDFREYVNVTDGIMWEGFAHASWESDEYFCNKDIVLRQIDLLSDISGRGKFFLALSGTEIPDNPTQEDIQKAHYIMLYCLASFLLGVNGPNAAFGWNSINSKDGSRGYYPEFDVPLGSPANQYYPIGAVYARDFAYGKVLVNPTTLSYTINLESQYKTLDGQVVSNVTVNAHSGVILLSH